MNAEERASVFQFIMDYETGGIASEEEIAKGFQFLLDTGIIHHLQGGYQRMAQHLIDRGLIVERSNKDERGN